MRIYLYGVGGADQMYRVVKYWCFFNIEKEPITIREIRYRALELRMRCPSIEHLYLIDGGLKLRYDYNLALRKNSIESWAVFKSLLETEGLQIL